MPPQQRQPLLHELVITLSAPTQVLSHRSGDISSAVNGPTAEGIIHADVRVVSELTLTVGGRPPEHLATHHPAAATDGDATTFTSVLRHLGDGSPDPQLRLDRHRRVEAGSVAEELVLSSVRPAPVVTTVRLAVGSDFAPIEQIKVGAPAGTRRPPVLRGEHADWQQGGVRATLTAPGAALELSDSRALIVQWPVTVPAHGSSTLRGGCR